MLGSIIASKIWLTSREGSYSASGVFGCGRTRCASSLERLEQLHHQERSALGRQVVVEDAHHPGMVDLVRDVALSEEAFADVIVGRDEGVEQLDRDPLAVAVGRLLDGGHPADVDQAVDRPLLVQRLPDPLEGHGARVRHGHGILDDISRPARRTARRAHHAAPA
jgi:hypothetical protein